MLLGQDGWADGRYGDYENSQVSLNDSRLIADLYQQRILERYQLLEKMQQLADVDAHNLRNDITYTISQHNPKKIIILTHVPPFKEACMYEGKISGDDFLSFFASKATGDVVAAAAKKHPGIEFLVLCGHTHHECLLNVLSNLTVRVGGAEYLHPEVQKTL